VKSGDRARWRCEGMRGGKCSNGEEKRGLPDTGDGRGQGRRRRAVPRLKIEFDSNGDLGDF